MATLVARCVRPTTPRCCSGVTSTGVLVSRLCTVLLISLCCSAGEFGGLGAFITGKEWAPSQCSTYLKCDTPQIEADLYVQMAGNISLYKNSPGVSVSIYTQVRAATH